MKTKITIKCPVCGREREIVKCITHRPKFTGICRPCNSKILGKKLGTRGRLRTAEKHPRWKGGKIKTKMGYIIVRLYPDNFFYPMAMGSGYVKEHRLVVAQALGRCLLPWEIVHHKEGYAKDDNRYPETLELLSDKRWHLIDSTTKSYIVILEKQINQLKQRVEELEGK